MTVAATVDSENVQNQGVLQKRCFSRRSLHRLFFSQSPAVSAVPTGRNSTAGKVCEKSLLSRSEERLVLGMELPISHLRGGPVQPIYVPPIGRGGKRGEKERERRDK